MGIQVILESEVEIGKRQYGRFVEPVSSGKPVGKTEETC